MVRVFDGDRSKHRGRKGKKDRDRNQSGKQLYSRIAADINNRRQEIKYLAPILKLHFQPLNGR
jgi:hypothetical protein